MRQLDRSIDRTWLTRGVLEALHDLTGLTRHDTLGSRERSIPKEQRLVRVDEWTRSNATECAILIAIDTTCQLDHQAIIDCDAKYQSMEWNGAFGGTSRSKNTRAG